MSDIKQLSDHQLADIRLKADSPAEAVDFLSAQDPRKLAVMMVNHVLNNFISTRNDDEAGIPYQGWFWRSVDFFTPRGVTIADGDGRVAICQNNKWGYPERDLTEVEQAALLTHVWGAYLASRKGGMLSEIEAETSRLLFEAGQYIDSLTIEKSN